MSAPTALCCLAASADPASVALTGRLDGLSFV